MQTRRCGNSDLNVSVITLGLMVRDCSPGEKFESVRQTVLRAVERGVTSIDMATGYGGGAVEEAFGKILKSDLGSRRHSLIIATKAGWADGTRKTLTESLDKSLRQLGVDSVDLYYHHAADEKTPFEETAATVDDLAKAGKTRHVGISNYSPPDTIRMALAFRDLGRRCVMHQCNYNMLNRWVEDGLLAALPTLGMSAAVFSTVAQGVLSDATLESGNGPRAGSRAEKMFDAIIAGATDSPVEPAYGRYAAKDAGAARSELLGVLAKLQTVAKSRGQTLAQLALAWTLRHPSVATALVGCSSPEQVDAAADAAEKLSFSDAERETIARILPPRWGIR